MADAGVAEDAGTNPADAANPADVPVCGACKQTMFEDDGVTPREWRHVGHNCSHCKVPLHAPMMCELVWFPIVSSNAREFCCKEHLILYNANEDTTSPIPVRRRQEEQEENILAPAAASEGTNEDKPQASKDDAPDPSPAPKAAPATAPEPAPPDPPVPPEDNTQPEDILSEPQTPYALKTQVLMNFKPTGSSWYGGVVGHVSGDDFYIGFDDGDLRHFQTSELNDLSEIGILKADQVAGRLGGMIDGTEVSTRAEALTFHKEGRMAERKPVGVLVGKLALGVGGLTLYAAHHVDAATLDEESERRSVRSRPAGSVANGRKGYHTFRCGDVVRCSSEEAEGMVAAVVGVIISTVGTQMRRMLVLCEHAMRSGSVAQTAAIPKLEFFISTWNIWNRMPPENVAEPPDFDPDDDDTVCILSPAETDAMMKEWDENAPLSKFRNAHSVVSAAGKDGLPPSRSKAKQPTPKPPAPAPKAKKNGGRGGRGGCGGGGGGRGGRGSGRRGPQEQQLPKPPAEPEPPAPPPVPPARTKLKLDPMLAAKLKAGKEADDEIERLESLLASQGDQAVDDDFADSADSCAAAIQAELARADAEDAARRARREQLLGMLAARNQKLHFAPTANPTITQHTNDVPAPTIHDAHARMNQAPPPRGLHSTVPPTQFLQPHGHQSVYQQQPHPAQLHPQMHVQQQGAAALQSHTAGLQSLPPHMQQPYSQQLFTTGQSSSAPYALGSYSQQPSMLPPTPECERATVKHIRMLRAQQFEDGVGGLAGKIAGLEFELEAMRKDRKRKATSGQ